MADDINTQLKLSQALVMTPQLQMAVRLLATPTAELGSMLDQITALEPAEPNDPDPLLIATDDEREQAEETSTPPWTFELVRPHGFGTTADVWISGDPPLARASREALPRLRVNRQAEAENIRDAEWFLRSLRMRAKTYERVVGALLMLRPALAGPQPKLDPIELHELADAVGFHESTVSRVAAGVRIETAHGRIALALGKHGITIG